MAYRDLPQHRDNSTHRQRVSIFSGRALVIATMHQKEKVLAPVLSSQLGVLPIVPIQFDTDQFGTFSGEVERPLNPLDTARLKCLHAYERTGTSLVVASEGSFGPHPVIGFIPADQEILVLMDFEHDLELKVQVTSTNTNFSGASCSYWKEVVAFSKSVQFPSHGLIIRKEKDDIEYVQKGINDWQTLERLFVDYRRQFGAAFVETDMRAMHNPSRMKVIEDAARLLAERANHLCLVCNMPGFDVKEVMPGLPCELCASPTKSTKALLYECRKCGHTEKKNYPNGRLFENPMYCDNCNP